MKLNVKNLNDTSPLSVLSPLDKPDCQRLLDDLKSALNRASVADTTSNDLWTRMEQNHNARFCWWPGQRLNCRKPSLGDLRPGEIPPQPWNNAADLRLRLVDGVIKDYGDLLDMAESRVVPSLLPTLMDPEDGNAALKAEAWGLTLQYYSEFEEQEMQRAKKQVRSIAWEYGHGVGYVGWQEERQLQPRTLTAEQVTQLIAAQQMGAYAEEMMGGGEEGGEGLGEQQMMAIADEALAAAEMLVMDKTLKPTLIEALRGIDPEMTEKEARRVAGLLPAGKPVTYWVPRIVRACPELRAFTPGLDIFYPFETVNIKRARFVVMPEWWSDVDMRAHVETRGWDGKSVEYVIEHAKQGRAAFFGLTDLQCTSVGWLLTGGLVGMGVRNYDAGTTDSRQWQMLTVFYRATDPDTGVPVLYRTTFHPDCPDHPVSHVASADDHARYPFWDYMREEEMPTLWTSRGVGELSISEQEELRHQANFSFDNASIAIKPPYEVSARSEVAKMGLGPGTRVVTSSGFSAAGGVRKIDIAGDARWSIEAQRAARARANEYHKLGVAEEMNPTCQQNAWQARVNEWVLAVKQCMKLVFATIQQHCPENIRASAVGGRAVQLNATREEIQGDFSMLMEFDVASLDPKTIEARAKMVREMVAPLDREGLIDTEPLIRQLMMSIHPRWGAVVKRRDAALDDETDKALLNIVRVLSGIEAKYISGGNPKHRLELTQKIFNMPALDEKGQPVVDEATGRPVPGPANYYLQTVPGVNSYLANLIKHEEFEMKQQENVEVGRKGVKEMQPGPGLRVTAEE